MFFIFGSMDIQADMNWIMTELRQVKDPHLIEAFKQLLIYRKTEHSGKEFDQAFERAIADKAEGRVTSHDQVRRKYDKWL